MSVTAVRRSHTTENAQAVEQSRSDSAPARRPLPSGAHTTEGSRRIQAQLAGPSAREVQARLNDFAKALAGPYRVGGESVFVPPPFRMVTSSYQLSVDKLSDKIRHAIGKAAFANILHEVGTVVSGKGSPEQLTRVTQALIDSPAYSAYKTNPPEAGIRRMMWDYGIGMDCSGYTHRALLATRPGQASRLRLGNPLDSNIQAAPATLFRKVSELQARPGDFVRLGPNGNEHKVIIFDRREIEQNDPLRARVAEKLASAPNARMILFEVDSSWGNGGKPEVGGADRRTWVYDDSTKRWATLVQGERGNWHVIPSNESGPYDHTLLGIHRPRGES